MSDDEIKRDLAHDAIMDALYQDWLKSRSELSFEDWWKEVRDDYSTEMAEQRLHHQDLFRRAR